MRTSPTIRPGDWQTSGAGGSGITRFIYDGDRLVEEYDGTGARLRMYVHGPVADELLVLYELTGGPVHRFYHSDQQGSVVALADDSGNALTINGYDAWGIPNGSNSDRFGYTGQAWISELGMYYYKARIYSPTLGRFMQTDPVGYKDQVNLYAYVGNDPVNRYDPDGKWDATVHNRVFEAAVGNRFSRFSMEQIQRYSRFQDWRGPDHNNNAAHYLRDVGQSRSEAVSRYRAFLTREIAAGREAVRNQNQVLAERHFAKAAHAVQDFYSPVHNDGNGPTEYRNDAGRNAFTNAVNQGHSPFEGFGRETTREVTPAVMKKMIDQTEEVYKRIFCSGSKAPLESSCR